MTYGRLQQPNKPEVMNVSWKDLWAGAGPKYWVDELGLGLGPAMIR